VRSASLAPSRVCPSLPFASYKTGGRAVTLTAVPAAAMIRVVRSRLFSDCDRLPIVVAEGAGDTGLQLGIVQRPQKAVKPQLEVMIHAPDHVVHRGHADFLRRVRILPREVLIHELGNCSRDVPLLALFLDRDADTLL